MAEAAAATSQSPDGVVGSDPKLEGEAVSVAVATPAAADAAAVAARAGAAMAPAPLSAAPLSTYVVYSASYLLPKPRQLELSARKAVGAVSAGGKTNARSHSMRTERPTSYRSVQRADEVEDLAPDGQVRLLPPDRPTRLCRLNYRDKVDIEQPAPFVARCARAEFAYHDAYLD